MFSEPLATGGTSHIHVCSETCISYYEGCLAYHNTTTL